MILRKPYQLYFGGAFLHVLTPTLCPAILDTMSETFNPEAMWGARRRSARPDDPNRALRNLSDALSSRLSAEDTELACIRAARRCGATWADIGEVYGVSRQAAHERWAKKV